LEFSVTGRNRHDSKEFEKLSSPIEEIELAVGVKAYGSRKNFELVVSKHGKPYLYFKPNAKGLAKGSPAWKQAYQELKANPEEWLEGFHVRSLIEAVNSFIKRRFGSFLLSRHLGCRLRSSSSRFLLSS
jgi:transposase